MKTLLDKKLSKEKSLELRISSTEEYSPFFICGMKNNFGVCIHNGKGFFFKVKVEDNSNLRATNERRIRAKA